ncbi:MAG: hypothetical protein PVJ57_01510 [Phycisphaerae bacterium]|jgi:hypothetical protein
MVLLESGPAKTDRYYWLVVTIAFMGFAGWCVYDWAYRYPAENRAAAATELARWTRVADDLITNLPERPTEEDFKRVRAAKPDRAMLEREFGKPLPPKADDIGPIDAARYASAWGMVTVPLHGDGRPDIARTTWQSWAHSPGDIKMQLYMAIIVGVIALYFVLRAYRAFTLRAVIDDDGMTYGSRRIPFENMVSLRDYNPKGWVDLHYRTSGGNETRLRIDNQKIACFSEIAELICEKKGFENPILAAQREDEEEDEEQDESATDETTEAEGNDDTQA